MLPSNGYMRTTQKTPLVTPVLLLYVQRRCIAGKLSDCCLRIRCHGNVFTESFPSNGSACHMVNISGEIKKGMIKIFPLICPTTSN
jgi:hypothetical protein